jgi:DNA-binding GntR family transcriptional regulator
VSVNPPGYQRIADDLRRAIIDGQLAPGAKLPSRHELAATYGVSDRVAVEAVRRLVAEGFAVTRPGAGSYVRQRPDVTRMTRLWYDPPGTSPFASAMTAIGKTGTWKSSSERAPMTPAIAARLAATPGKAAMRTRYTFLADAEPVMLSTSWEPLDITDGTPVTLPEEGPHAGRGVIARMAVIGQHITRAEEAVTARPVLADEASRLRIPLGAIILAVARTYATSDRPVETADIVIPAERWALVYQIPIGR